MLANSAGNVGIVWSRWKLGQTNVKWGDRRGKCEEASQWLEGEGGKKSYHRYEERAKEIGPFYSHQWVPRM
jgi:hypothetical protein